MPPSLQIVDLPAGIAPAGTVVAAVRLGAPASIDVPEMAARGARLGTTWILPPTMGSAAYGARLARDTDRQVISEILLGALPEMQAEGWRLILVPGPLIGPGLRYAAAAAGGAELGGAAAGLAGDLAAGAKDAIGGVGETVRGVGGAIGVAPWILGAAAVVGVGALALGVYRWVRS